MTSNTALLAAVATLGLSAAHAQSPTPTPQAVLAAAKQASGGTAWNKLTTTHDSGTVKAGGLSGTYDDWLDWPHLLQAGSYVLGPATGAQGYDGKVSWTTDSSGQVRIETSAEALSAAVQQAYGAVFAPYFPGRYPAEIVMAGPRSDAGKSFIALKITPKGADPVEIWFDRATHLPDRMIQLTGTQPATTYFSDYRAFAGVMLPAHSITRVGNNPAYDQVVDMVAMAAVPVPASRFAPPPPPAYDAYFPTGKTSVTVPFRLLNNHIYLLVGIDGKPPVPFMFDTGATNFMDSSHATTLGVKTEGALPGGGFGSAISAVGLAKVASVSVGGLALRDQVFSTNDLGSFRKVEGMDGAGLIGYEFAKRTVVTIDYAHRTMTFTKPDAYHPSAGAQKVPFTFAAHIPMVAGSIDGVSGQFEIDTGSRGGLALMHPFAVANNLVDKYHATVLATAGYGVGGPSKALLGRGGVLMLGDVAIKAPVLDVVMDAHGAAAATHTAGNIGGDLLKRFTVTLDYGHQLLFFQPNALAAQRDVFDRSGLWVNRADDGAIAIGDVTAGGPGSKAGLMAADEITAIDGKSAAKLQIYDVRDMFKGKPGTVVKLTLRGGRKVALRLVDQV